MAVPTATARETTAGATTTNQPNAATGSRMPTVAATDLENVDADGPAKRATNWRRMPTTQHMNGPLKTGQGVPKKSLKPPASRGIVRSCAGISCVVMVQLNVLSPWGSTALSVIDDDGALIGIVTVDVELRHFSGTPKRF
jgi:hypothetical protein